MAYICLVRLTYRESCNSALSCYSLPCTISNQCAACNRCCYSLIPFKSICIHVLCICNAFIVHTQHVCKSGFSHTIYAPIDTQMRPHVVWLFLQVFLHLCTCAMLPILPETDRQGCIEICGYWSQSSHNCIQLSSYISIWLYAVLHVINTSKCPCRLYIHIYFLSYSLMCIHRRVPLVWAA